MIPWLWILNAVAWSGLTLGAWASDMSPQAKTPLQGSVSGLLSQQKTTLWDLMAQRGLEEVLVLSGQGMAAMASRTVRKSRCHGSSLHACGDH